MKQLLARIVRMALDRVGYVPVPRARLSDLCRDAEHGHFLRLLQALPVEVAAQCLPLLARRRSQFGQDLLALAAAGFKRGGYFVEFGATDGAYLSNTHLLEADYGWRGILAEPARRWHAALRANRQCILETRCVWSRSGEQLRFTETPAAELSTLANFSAGDLHARLRRGGVEYPVETISLNELLAANAAPAFIDYLSVDTEGSEFDILAALDFERHRFGLITVEHNHGPQRERLFALLTGHGYRRILEAVSACDDWYVHPQHVAATLH